MKNLKELEINLLLNDAISDGTIDIDSVLDTIMANQREKVREIHKYSITPPPKEGSRWQTWYKDSAGNTKNIKAQTEEELLDKLAKLYFGRSHIDNMTFNGLYKEWLDYKKTITDSPNTILRHEQHYRKYFESSKLNDAKIRKIDILFLEVECNRIVKDFNLTQKEWTNIKTILNGMFSYAVRKKYLTDNPVKEMKIQVKFKQVVKKTGKTETYNTDELAALILYLDQMYAETDDTIFLAVKLNFFLGLRIGELVALKWEDYRDLNHLHIVREEIRNQSTNTYEIVEHTKTNQDRYVVLVPKAISILQKIEHSGSFIFMRDGERITSRQIAYVLEKYAERQGLTTKSSHKIRKTFASTLNANGVPLDCIRELLGHNNLSTTLGYIYNPLTEGETYDLIVKAL